MVLTEAPTHVEAAGLAPLSLNSDAHVVSADKNRPDGEMEKRLSFHAEELPAKYGTWAFNVGATYYYLPNQNAWVYDATIPNDKTANSPYAFSGGIGATF